MEKLELPKDLSSCLDNFERFYLNKHQGQKLIWCLGLSKIEIQYLYLKNKNVSISTLIQLLSLLLLEKNGETSLGQIALFLGCNPSTVIADIQGLVYNPSFNPHAQIDKGIIKGSFQENSKEFKSIYNPNIYDINKSKDIIKKLYPDCKNELQLLCQPYSRESGHLKFSFQVPYDA